MGKRILMTGATGFVGSHVLDLLSEYDFDITIIKRSTSNIERIEGHMSKLACFDLDTINLEQVFQSSKFDIIIHLATLYSKSDHEIDCEEMHAINVKFPKKILKLAIKYNVKSFINTSSYFQYSPHKLPISENNKLLPFNEYAKTKTLFAQHLESCSDQIKVVNLILFTPYGPRDNNKLVTHVVKKSIRNDTIALSQGLQKIDFVYVKDVASAYLKSIRFLDISVNGYTDFCLASGFPISVRELVSLVEEVNKTIINKSWGEPSSRDYPVVFGDTKKAKDILDWSATTDLKQGLKETIYYFKNKYTC